MTQLTIRQEIESRVAAWAASQIPPLKVSYENVAFTKPTTSFIEVYVNPSSTVNKGVAGLWHTIRGFVQVNIYTKAGEGTKLSETLAQSLIDAFPVVPKTGTVSIEETGSIMESLPYDAQWRVTPVRFRFRQENTM